jgi:uncharacterized protein (TIGR02270 family)
MKTNQRMINSQKIILEIIDQHAEEAAFLWGLRRAAVSAPHYNLQDLADLDERVEAHIDGLRVAGKYGFEACLKNLEYKEAGEVFATCILALENDDIDQLEAMYQFVENAPETIPGLVSAFGWVQPDQLQGKVNGLLVSKRSLWRRIGISVCAIHRVNPGYYLELAIEDDDIDLSCRAIRATGELGRNDLKPLLLRIIENGDCERQFWSSWSAVLLGDRGKGLDQLKGIAGEKNKYQMSALPLVMRIFDKNEIKEMIGGMIQQQNSLRVAIIASGLSGDPAYIPWLIQQLEIAVVARVAGEAISLITGIDIAYQDLEGEWPENFEAGPTENPEDKNVAMDLDEDLPWADPVLMAQWWVHHEQDFVPGNRYLLGKTVSEKQCNVVLKTGFQRQRKVAALDLVLMRPPGTILFETSTVGKRQQSLLT